MLQWRGIDKDFVDTLLGKAGLGMNNYFKGILYAALSAFIYGLSPWAVMFVLSHGGTELSSCFFRCLLSLPFAYLILLRLPKEERRLNRTERKHMLILSSLFSITMMLLISSYSLVGTGIATTLHFSYPAFTLLICAVFYKERIRPLAAGCVLLTLTGVVLCYSPGPIDNLLGTLIAFTSGFTYAWYMVYLSKSGMAKMHPIKLVFYLHICMATIIGTVAFATGNLPVQMPLQGWAVQLLLSVSLTLGATTLFPMGVRRIGPQRTAILSTFEPLTAIFMGILTLAEPITGKDIVGMVLILLAVIILTVGDRKHGETEASQAMLVSPAEKCKSSLPFPQR